VSQIIGRFVSGSIRIPPTGQASSQSPQDSHALESTRTQPFQDKAPAGQASIHPLVSHARHTRIAGVSGQSSSTQILERLVVLSPVWVIEQISMQIRHSVHFEG
jgi:hypothetical protein